MKHRLFIVEDHSVVREGYVSLINSEPDLEVCGEAASAEEAFERAAGLAYDLAIVDLSLPGVNGVELIKRLRSYDEGAQVLVVSAHDEALYAERALRAGARGYLMKRETGEAFLEAIHRVLSGELYLSDAVRNRILDEQFGLSEDAGSGVDSLTDREIEVFEHFGRGRGTREVADALGLSHKTIESHRTNIKRKLGIDGASEFTRRAVLWVEAPLNADTPE